MLIEGSGSQFCYDKNLLDLLLGPTGTGRSGQYIIKPFEASGKIYNQCKWLGVYQTDGRNGTKGA